jgi:hypothetical protein
VRGRGGTGQGEGSLKEEWGREALHICRLQPQENIIKTKIKLFLKLRKQIISL